MQYHKEDDLSFDLTVFFILSELTQIFNYNDLGFWHSIPRCDPRKFSRWYLDSLTSSGVVLRKTDNTESNR